MKRSTFAILCLPLVVGFSGVPSARATLVSVTGAGLIVPAPALIGDPNNPLATHQQGFDEKQGVFLIGPVSVDSGSIGPGIRVDSHMIFFNQSGTGSLTTEATWTFSGAILGVMSDSFGSLEAASSSFLGAPGTLGYPSFGFSMRGKESDDSYMILTPHTLKVTMHIAQPGDWIRVVTASVPDGGNAGVLVGLGLVCLAAFRRKSLGA